MNKISYKDAAKLLKKSEGTVKHAVGRDVFTKFPTAGQTQYLIQEQVELFINKTQLTLGALSKEELDIWTIYDKFASTLPTSQEMIASTREEQISLAVEKAAEEGYRKGAIHMANALSNVLLGIVRESGQENIVLEKLSKYPLTPLTP